jgi:threonine/homoserine/homoserine lactone efflux protein
MHSADSLVALIAFAFVSSITPGPNNLMLMTSGTNFGFQRTVPHFLGVSGGFVVMTVLVGAGAAWLFTALPFAGLGLKVLSVAYLLYLAWRIGTAAPPKLGESGSRPLTFLQAAAFQWVNPKAWTMALTAVSVHLPEGQRWAGLVTLAVVFGAVNLPSVGVWALLGVQLRRLLDHPRALRAFNVTAALLLVASLWPVLSEDFAPAAP